MGQRSTKYLKLGRPRASAGHLPEKKTKQKQPLARTLSNCWRREGGHKLPSCGLGFSPLQLCPLSSANGAWCPFSCPQGSLARSKLKAKQPSNNPQIKLGWYIPWLLFVSGFQRGLQLGFYSARTSFRLHRLSASLEAPFRTLAGAKQSEPPPPQCHGQISLGHGSQKPGTLPVLIF